MVRRIFLLLSVLLAVGLLALMAACAGVPKSGLTSTAPAIVVSVTSSATSVPPSTTPQLAVSAAPWATFTTTHTPRPAFTTTPASSATTLPSQTASPTSIATKQVLLQIGYDPGDGGGYPLDFDRFAPKMVLYTDGELLVPDQHAWYLETVLSTPEMCTLLSKIADTGFFQIEGTGELGRDDSIYHFAATPELSMGGPSFGIQVNGRPAKFVSIYRTYQDSAVSPIKAVLRLLQNYRPAGLKPFHPERLLLLVDVGRDLFDSLQFSHGDKPTPTPQVQVWPADLPPLADWWGGPQFNPVFVQGDLVDRLLTLNMPEHVGIFTDRGQEYTILVTAFLPHAMLNELGYGYSYPYQAMPFDLPLHCLP